MMMTATLFIAATILGSVQEIPEVVQSHRRFLLNHCDVSDYSKHWSNDKWRMRCCFFDFDGDGVDEIVATDVSRMDRSGDSWYVWTVGCDDRLVMLKGASNFVWNCHADSFFVLKKLSGHDEFLGLGLCAGFLDERRINVLTNMPDCKIEKVGKMEERLEELKPSLDAVFRNLDVVSIERLYPEWYFGFDFKPPPNKPHSPYTLRMPYKLPKGNLRYGGEIQVPKSFASFVAEYREELRKEQGKNRKITIFAILLDADRNGEVDCYVSSDCTEMDGGRLTWNLYLNQGGIFTLAKEPILPSLPCENSEIFCLKPTVHADKDAFCRVIRYDVEPLFLMLDDLPDKSTKVRAAITDYHAHRIEKLPCREFAE